uniref:Uncharacterized protein n=1 Tax=Chenopodium quinoa TaxID=63459 RepID=A0A803MIE1_CHEQI
MKLDSSDKEVQEVIEVKEGSDNDDDEKVRKRIASEAKASFGQGEIQKDVYAVCRKRGQQSYIGDVIETAYGNLVDRERRLVSFNLPNGVMTDSDIHESAHDEVEEDLLLLARDSTLFAMLHAERINCITHRIKKNQSKEEKEEEKDENKEEKKEDEKVKEKNEKEQEEEADVSVVDDANTANQASEHPFNFLNEFASKIQCFVDCGKTGIEVNYRPLEIFLASQKTSQEAKDCSPKSILAELSQAWLDWLQLCNEKHQFMEVDLVEEMSELMNKLEHPKAEDIMSYEFDNVSFPWKSTKQTLNCGVF